MNCPHIFPWEVVDDYNIETKNNPAGWNRRTHRARSLGTVCDSRLLQFCLDRGGRSRASAHACQRCRDGAAHGAALRGRRVQLLVLSDKKGDHRICVLAQVVHLSANLRSFVCWQKVGHDMPVLTEGRRSISLRLPGGRPPQPWCWPRWACTPRIYQDTRDETA
jgi:hypothetical protein